MNYAINKSLLPRYLRKVAKHLAVDGDSWESTVCEMAADDMELLQGIIVNDPVELSIEEGDQANG